MIRTVRVKNFKSIPDLTLDLGRVTVLIGANGSGKSNVLEAIAFLATSARNRLDNEFLTSRGVRVTETQFMRSAFADPAPDITISVSGDAQANYSCVFRIDECATYPRWKRSQTISPRELARFLKITKEAEIELSDVGATGFNLDKAEHYGQLLDDLLEKQAGTLPDFLLFSPENTTLRTFQSEGQTLPLGIKGEGLFAHLKALNAEKYRSKFVRIKETLKLIDWFDSFDIPDNLSPGERSIRIHDRYLPEMTLFDQRSANEGFLFLLFYITLFVSPDTPAFFAIDNIDSSLNPKLCIALLQQIAILAKEFDKQVILTTHNPAVLDGLDLNDDEQRLLVVERNKDGHTRVRRVEAPKPSPAQTPVSLSEAFMRGYIGGLPKSF